MSADQQALPLDEEDLQYKLRKPFESAKAANSAVKAFVDEVYDLRVKHGLANVSVIIKDSIAGSGPAMSRVHYGDEGEQESMAAWYHGQASADRQDMVRRAMEFGAREAIKQLENRQ